MKPEVLGPLVPLADEKIRCQGARHKCFRPVNFPGWVAKICEDPDFRLSELEQEACVEKHREAFGTQIPETHICTPKDIGFPIVLQREIQGRVLAEIKPVELSVDQLHTLHDFLDLVISFVKEHGAFDLVGWQEKDGGISNAQRKFFGRWCHRAKRVLHLKEFLMQDFDILQSSNLMFDQHGKLWYIDCVETREMGDPAANYAGLERFYVQSRTMFLAWFRKNHSFRLNQKRIQELIFVTAGLGSMDHSESRSHSRPGDLLGADSTAHLPEGWTD